MELLTTSGLNLKLFKSVLEIDQIFFNNSPVPEATWILRDETAREP